MKAPMIHYAEMSASDDPDPGFYVGVALDEIASWAIEHGCPASQFIERAEEAVERAGGEW